MPTIVQADMHLPRRKVDSSDRRNVHTMICERIERALPKIIRADSTHHRNFESPSTESGGTAYKVCRCSSESRAIGKNIPKDFTETNDNRSYHINSDKIARLLGFKPKRNIEDAVRDLCRAFAAGKLPGSMEDASYINVRTIKQRNAA